MTGRLVGFTGLKQAGKGESALHLVANHEFTLVKFAQGLKDMLRAIGLTEAEIEGHLKGQPCELLCGKTPRHAMQTLGSDWGRAHIGDRLWVQIWGRKVRALLDAGRDVVCDDVRFHNEGRAVHALGGRLYRVSRPGCDEDGHESEQQIAQLVVDGYLFNNKSLLDLQQAVDEVILRPPPTVRGLKFSEK